MLPSPTHIITLLDSGEPMTKSEILTALGAYDEAKSATEDMDPVETYEYYTNLDGLFYSSIKRIRKALEGRQLVSINKHFAITSDPESIQEYLATPQRAGRTGTYLEGMSRIQGEIKDEVENGDKRSGRIDEATKRYKSWTKIV